MEQHFNEQHLETYMYCTICKPFYVSLGIYPGAIPHRGMRREPCRPLKKVESLSPERNNRQKNATLPPFKTMSPGWDVLPWTPPRTWQYLHAAITVAALVQHLFRQYSEASSQFCLLPRPPNSCAASMQ